MEDDYSKREIDTFMDEIKETLGRIETQTIKTNGSVRSLQVWRGFITGGLAILALIVIPLLFMLIKIR